MANDVLEKLEPHENRPQESILRMRRILEYRLDVDQKESPKARILILGYLDPDHENRPVASPTMTRNPRQLLFQLGSSMGFSAAKGDVSGALLQGCRLQRDFLGAASARTGSSPNRGSGRNLTIEKAN